MDTMKKTQRRIVDDCSQEDTVTLITFARDVNIIFRDLRMNTQGKFFAHDYIESQEAHGMTSTFSLFSLLAEISKCGDEIYVFTDGVPTIGPGVKKCILIDRSYIINAAKSVKGLLTIFGFRVKMDLAAEIASARKGTSISFIGSEDQIQESMEQLVSYMKHVKYGRIIVKYKCDCGNIELIMGDDLILGFAAGQIHHMLFKVTPFNDSERIISTIDVSVDGVSSKHISTINRGATTEPTCSETVKELVNMHTFDTMIESSPYSESQQRACKSIIDNVGDSRVSENMEVRLKMFKQASMDIVPLMRQESMNEIKRKKRKMYSIDRSLESFMDGV